ncbi:MAG: type II toxin-antitoxin system RatA family toxin [Gammaproteobacteria bacterium]|nr:type II toxin-antitoxin system RatA family toxin [Gammaproteobacteria bacterium]
MPFSREQIFNLVADVERYPEFLPLWHHAKITRSPEDSSLYVTVQTLQLGLMIKRFRTETRLRSPDSIDVRSSDPLFDRFHIHWSFETGPDGSCLVDFLLDCEARSIFLRPMLDLLLLDTARSTVGAFERRAHALYGAVN